MKKQRKPKQIQEANKYDKIIKENIEDVFIPLILNRYCPNRKGLERLTDQFYTTEDRESDLLLKITSENDVVSLLHVEFQSKPDYEMLFRMSEYHGMIVRMYQLPVYHLLIELGSEKANLETKLPESLIFRGFEILRMDSLKYEDLIKSSVPAEIILTILSDFGGKKPQTIIRHIAKQLRSVSKSDAELKKYISQLNILARLRDLESLTIQTVSKMPITFDIDNDAIAKMAVERDRRKTVETMLEEGSLSIKLIANIMNLQESDVLQIQIELAKKNKKK
jgi:predicted transposase YdaD